MKKFIKNSCLSLIKFKWTLFILFLFSFIVSVLFTSYSNATKSHLNEYNLIMEKGVKPDVSIYENYDFSFSIKAKETVSNSSKWVFSFDSSSKYVKYATHNNPNHYEFNEKIDGKGTQLIQFKPYDANFSWTPETKMTSSEMEKYIHDKTTLLTTMLKSDNISNVAGFLKKKYDEKNVLLQNFQSITVQIDQLKVYEIAIANSDDLLNKIVYTSGEENNEPTKSDNQIWNKFKENFWHIKEKTEHLNDYVESDLKDFYKAIYVNLPDEFTETEQFKKSLEKLLSKLSDPNTELTDTDKKNLDEYFKEKFSIGSIIPGMIALSWKSGKFLIPREINIVNPRSYQTIISTANVYNGNYQYSKEAFNEWEDFLKNSNNKYHRETIINKLFQINQKYPKSVVTIGNKNEEIPFIISGSGITPNYVYPIAGTSLSNLGKINNSILMYMGENGYQIVRHGNQTAPTSSITYAKFPNFSQKKIEKITEEINKYAQNYMTLMGNRSCYLFDEPRGLNTIPALRVIFLPNITKKINSIFMYVCILLGILVFMVNFFTIKNIIDRNKNIISIFNANGFSMPKLVSSFIFFLAIPALLGCFIGFIVGIFTQELVNIFLSNYWVTISPVPAVNWLPSVIVFGAFIFTLLLGTMFFGVVLTKKNLAASLKNNDNYKNSRIINICKKPFFFTSIITRFRISIIFNTFQKLLILTALVTFMTTTVSFFILTNGSFDNAKKNLLAENNFAHAIELHTPTTQSGPIKYTEYYDLGKTAPGFSNTANTEKFFDNWRNLQFLSLKTLEQYKENILLLKDSIISRLQLDFNFGGESISKINVWNIVKGIMPTNQLVASNTTYEGIMGYLASLPGGNEFIDPEKKIVKDNVYESVGGINIGISNAYKKFLLENFFDKQRILSKQKINNYYVAYNTVGLDPQVIGGREFCKKIENDYIYSPPKYAFLKIISDSDINIYGIQDNDLSDANYLGPKLFLLNSSDDKPANSMLYENKETVYTNENEPLYNIIINNALATKNSLKIGDILNLNVVNTADRITQKIKADRIAKKSGEYKANEEYKKRVKFKVIGISRGSKNPQAYISYDNANKILGYLPNTSENTYYYFNGFYASKSDQLNFLKKIFTLVSPSGLYPGTPFFDNEFAQKLSETIQNNKNILTELGKILCYEPSDLKPEKANEYVQILNDYYRLPYLTAYTNFFSTISDTQLFETTSFVTNTLVTFAMLTIICVTCCAIILISFLILNGLKNIGTRLQILGYSKHEVISWLLSAYIPSFIIGIFISHPLLIISLGVFHKYIFNLTGIVLVLKTSAIAALISGVATLMLLAISFLICHFTFFKISSSKSIKDVSNN